jgi:hypothetical protein
LVAAAFDKKRPDHDKGRFAKAATDQARQFGLALEMEEPS